MNDKLETIPCIESSAALPRLVSSRYLVKILRLTPLAIAVMMSSCSSTSQFGHSSAKATLATTSSASNWQLVKKNPPTYYPKGYPTDFPTTHKDGDWIYAGSNGEQWFIPKNGVKGFTPEKLQQEALSRRTISQRVNNSNRAPGSNETDAVDVMDITWKSAVTAVLIPPSIMAMGGGGELDWLEEVWYE